MSPVSVFGELLGNLITNYGGITTGVEFPQWYESLLDLLKKSIKKDTSKLLRSSP